MNADTATTTTDPVLELCARSKQTKELIAFRDFHAAHPEVFDFIVDEAQLLISKGHNRFSFHSLFQYCRWKVKLEGESGVATGTGRPGSYKINDHHNAFYGRAITILRPDIANGHVEFRASKVDAVFGVALGLHRVDGRTRLVWADGTPLERGWRPSKPYVPTHQAKRRPHVHARQEAGATWTCRKCGASNAA